ncbi:hypothetical protein D915_010755 [Fasciola hepatica]|uniref:Uncharacterized protein n=1 Tax=Fasciola hepatica TaxID=6192 RepID=A0A4E0RMN2_FASHE|nr:hypothetical protein D915_010755 [Fasciola hepatica]
MEMQLKPGRLGSSEAADADFPTIGTWAPHTKPNTEHQEKLLQESIGPKILTSTRNAVGTGESPNNTNWIGVWSSNGNVPNTGVNTARSGLSNISNRQIGPRAFPSTVGGSVTGGTKAEPPQPQQQQQPQPQLSSQPQQSGSQNTWQWLLIHSAPRHHQGSVELNHLHMLLSQFELANFHFLNSFTGLVLVRIQSSEPSLRLMYNLADRCTIEAISEPEALSHLQQLNFRLRSDNRTSGQFSPLGEMGGLSTGIASSSRSTLRFRIQCSLNQLQKTKRPQRSPRCYGIWNSLDYHLFFPCLSSEFHLI